jgi:hypothetical protein
MTGWSPRTRESWIALAVGASALVACLWLGRFSMHQALVSYLFAFVFFTGLSAGSLALAMVPILTGGGWGDALRPQLLAAARVLPLQALLSLPLLLGVRALYPWADPHVLAGDALLRAQSWYLDQTFFTVRTIGYFSVWLLLAAALERRLDEPDRLARIAAPGLILYTLTVTLAAVDWIMSLSPHWHSTVFGMMIATGWILAAAALAILCATWGVPADAVQPQQRLLDLGNLLLALLLAWSYLEFVQYLTVWIADLPAETSWYIPRTLTTWRYLAWFLIAFNFAVPFVVLLSRRAKQRRGLLMFLGSTVLIASLADCLWLVVPGLRVAGLTLRWTDLFAPLGIGGLWLCFFLGHLRIERLPERGRPTAALRMGHAGG